MIVTRIEDWILRLVQRRCKHPGEMVASDILEGCADGIAIKYCRRCGAVKTDWKPDGTGSRFVFLNHCWRMPDPFLWRGR